MKMGINTFGLGPYLKEDQAGVWQGLKDGGITAVEPCISFHPPKNMPEDYEAVCRAGIFDGVFPIDTAGQQITMLRDMGFEVFSFQLNDTPFTLEELTAVIPFMKENRLHYCIYSFMDRSVERVESLAGIIRAATDVLRQHGMELLIHNHDMEWLPDRGTSVMHWLLENIPQLRFELDLGWTEYAGVSAVEILKTYPDRFPLLHIKEIAPGATAWSDKPFCTTPGEGILPLKKLLDQVKAMGMTDEALLIDQDNAISGDILGDIAKGVRNIAELWG